MKQQINVNSWCMVRKVLLVLSDIGILPSTGSNLQTTSSLLSFLSVLENCAMSRCFPFPPPGYERKSRPEDLDLLKEAKLKEKKHKKEKKDKERKKDKEKEKDGGDEKQRDKKDRKGKDKEKEKHKDKKDKEDRSKDKDKSSISEESTLSGKRDEKSSDRLYPNGHNPDRTSAVDEKIPSTLFQGQNWNKPSQSSIPSHVTKESKFMHELDRRIRDDKSRGSQLPERVATVEKRDQKTVANAPVRDSSIEKGNNKCSRVDYEKTEMQRLRNGSDRSEMVQNLGECNVEIPKLLDGQIDRMVEGKEKYKETGYSKGTDRDKKIQGKDQIKKEWTEKEEKTKAKFENKKKEPTTLKDVGRNDPITSINNGSTDLPKDVNGSTEINARKRKDMETNGFVHEIEIRLSKIPRPDPHDSKENGSRRDTFVTQSISSHHDKHVVVSSSIGVDNKERFVNGKIDGHNKPSTSKPLLSPATIVSGAKIENRESSQSKLLLSPATIVSDQVLKVPKIHVHESESLNETLINDQVAEISRRPPHPDTNYLKEVLSVPSVRDWLENDDKQEWLFRKKYRSDKPKVATSVEGVNEEELRVWSEAVYIQSADICALPYVIPY